MSYAASYPLGSRPVLLLFAGSYGNLARFTDLRRIIKVGDHSLVGAGGEISDFQQISEYLGELV